MLLAHELCEVDREAVRVPQQEELLAAQHAARGHRRRHLLEALDALHERAAERRLLLADRLKDGVARGHQLREGLAKVGNDDVNE
eukprot:18441-Chlamydomonas_euryale.AAC.1